MAALVFAVVSCTWNPPRARAQQPRASEAPPPPAYQLTPLDRAWRKVRVGRARDGLGAIVVLVAPPVFITTAAFETMGAESCEDFEDVEAPGVCAARYDTQFRRYMIGMGVVGAAGAALLVHGIVQVVRGKRLYQRLAAEEHLSVVPRRDGAFVGARFTF